MLIFSSIQAQDFPSRVLHEGYLVTNDMDTVRGLVKYDMETNVVQVYINRDQVKTFSSKKILYFEIFDKSVKNYRQFYSLPHQVNINYRAQALFEVLYEGPLTLLGQEKIVVVTDPYSQAYYNGPSATREKLEYTYFFVNQKGKMKEYNTGKSKDLLEILVKHQYKVKDFIKENKLKTDRMRDIVRITAFYNSL